MRITQAQPISAPPCPIVLTKVATPTAAPTLRPVPTLSQTEMGVFAGIERKAQAMTIDTLMKMMEIN